MEHIDIDNLVSDRKAFNAFVYTPLADAIQELKKRAVNKSLHEKIELLVQKDMPFILKKGKPRAVMFRQIATPNYEMRRFLHLLENIQELDPMVGEYCDDKFFSINEQKRYWGKIIYFEGLDKPTSHTHIINFTESEGKKISEVQTVHGKSLVEFHHDLFEKTFFPVKKDTFYNISEWIYNHGKVAREYYKPVLAWFLSHAILFENFVLTDPKELIFIKEVFLPAFIAIYQETGYKPLIVDLLPTHVEDRKFWFCHPKDSQAHIESDILK